ncbi:4522_t:CDS:1, partial [Gigaspora margarita]
RAMEEPELAVPGSKSGLVGKLLVRAQALSRKSVSNDWNRRLDKAWDIYKGYCEVMNLEALPSEADTLVSFLVWLDLAHSFSGYVDFLAAVSREHLENRFTDPSKDYRVKRICKALVKEYKKDKEPRWPRDPLPVNALRQFVDKKPPLMNGEYWIRDAALVAIGLRTMRRP